jgi:hypothetical protein
MHQVGPMDGGQTDSDDFDDDDGEEIRLCSFRGRISDATTDEGLCDGHSTLHDNADRGEKKGKPPIPKSAGRKGGASKYAGIAFQKQSNKWQARIRIEGKNETIGDYDDDEEEAAVEQQLISRAVLFLF